MRDDADARARRGSGASTVPVAATRVLFVGLVVLLALEGILAAIGTLRARPVLDLWFYWEAGRRWPDIYSFTGAADFEVFRYPPASALLFVPLSVIPLPLLSFLWFVANLGLLRWSLRWWRLAAVVALMPPVAVELVAGDVNILAGALLLRLPWANGLLAGFAPKPYVALLALRGGRKGVAARGSRCVHRDHDGFGRLALPRRPPLHGQH